ncbi:MAG TPA: HemK/PrmC family methyltransferase [Candidatus Saccharimonadales bacterium]|nr:HemK/PrmC family methyltransferase [Candidatus Saccharimonadales bacterium]
MNTTTNSSQTSNKWLKHASQKLSSVGIESADLDALILLEYCLGMDRAKILAEPDLQLSPRQTKVLNELLSRRVKFEPIAYITKKSEFYGRSFFVSRDVLIPRPESEAFIDLLGSINLGNLTSSIDVGCGSGCLGISAKLSFPKLSVELTDNSKVALKVARLNAQILSANVEIYYSDLMKNKPGPRDIVLANLPYVPDAYPLSPTLEYEPSNALRGGKDGLELYRKLWAQIGQQKSKYVMCESLDQQHPDLCSLAKSYGYKLVEQLSLVQLFVCEN